MCKHHDRVSGAALLCDWVLHALTSTDAMSVENSLISFFAKLKELLLANCVQTPQA